MACRRKQHGSERRIWKRRLHLTLQTWNCTPSIPTSLCNELAAAFASTLKQTKQKTVALSQVIWELLQDIWTAASRIEDPTITTRCRTRTFGLRETVYQQKDISQDLAASQKSFGCMEHWWIPICHLTIPRTGPLLLWVQLQCLHHCYLSWHFMYELITELSHRLMLYSAFFDKHQTFLILHCKTWLHTMTIRSFNFSIICVRRNSACIGYIGLISGRV